jgi:ribonucleoside-diphosphate reductase alpha chain
MKIAKITKQTEKVPTWDIEVNDVHEYVLDNGVVSHNTSSIFGNEASTEAQTSNIYSRRVLSGEFIIVNKHLISKLCDLNLWNEEMKNKIIGNNGSVQSILEIPTEIRNMFKTAYEISQKDVIDMYADRGAFIDQTQSMNIFMQDPTIAKLNSMHFYGWGGGVTKDLSENPNPKYGSTPEKALKTGMYYLRGKAATGAVKFTVQQDAKKEYTAEEGLTCSLDNPEACEACSA